MAVVSILGTLTALAFRRGQEYEVFFTAAFWFAVVATAGQLIIVILGQIMPQTVQPSLPLVGSVIDLSTLSGLVLVSVLIAFRLLQISGRARLGLMILAAASLALLALYSNTFVWVIVALVALGLFVEAVMRRSTSAGDSDLDGVSVVAEADSGADSGERSLTAPLITLAVSLFFILGSAVSGQLATALNVSVLDVRPSWQSTLAVGQKVYSSSPIFGSGPTTFGQEWLKYRDASLNQTVFWNLDFSSGVGFIPTSLITTGLLGALAWILLIGAMLYLSVRYVVLSSTSDPYVRFVTVMTFAGAAYLTVMAVVTNVGALSLALLFIFIGLFASTLRYAPGKTQWGVIFSKSPRIGFVIVFVLTIVLLGSVGGAYVVVERYLAELGVLRAQIALSQGDLGKARSTIDNAIALSPMSEAYRVQARVAQGQMARIANDTSQTPEVAQQNFQQELAGGITAALSATRIAPNEYQSWSVLGDLYAAVVPLNVEGAYDNALSAYQKARELHPTSPLIPYSIAQLEIGAGKAVQAREALTSSITLKQDYTPAIFLLSQLEVASGNVQEALQAAEAAAYFTPSDAGILFQVGVLRAATNNTSGAIQALSSAVGIDTQFANARYFLAALYAKQKNYTKAIEELTAIAAINADNATAVAPLIADLEKSKDPFPPNLLSITPPSL